MSIIGGFTSLLLGRNDTIAKARRAKCKGCFVSDYGASKWCKVRNGGCGCLLSAKTRDKDEECPIGKWGKV
jgi:hypothetical protein